MMEMFLEGERIDVNQELSSLITFALDDIKDFASRNCTFSKTIILPGTANNNKQFGDIFNVQVSNPYVSTLDNVATNFNASVGADCLIFQNRLQVFKGTLRLLKVLIDNGQIEYEVAVFGELGGLALALGNKKIEELDFSAYDQAWSMANVTGSWDQTNATGICWPLIDYGQVSNNKHDYSFRAFRPAFYVREIIDKSFTNAGYSWDCDLFNTSRFKSLIVPNNQKTLQTIQELWLLGTDANTQTIIQNGVDNEAPIPQDTRNLTNFTYSGGVYTYTGTDTKQFVFRLQVEGDYYSTDEAIIVAIKKNGVEVGVALPFLVPTGGTTNVPYSSDVNYVYLTLSTGDTVEGSARINFSTGSYRMRTTSVRFEGRLIVPTYADADYLDTITVNDTLPKNILQKDFISSIVRLFNLYIYEDKLYPKKLFIAPYVDFYDLNPSGVVDWTYKVDRSRMLSLTPMSELNSRYYNFKFKQDNDYYNELYYKTYNDVYGCYKYDSEFEFANEKTDVELLFSPSVLVGYEGEDKVVTTLFKKNAGVEETYATNIRILQFKKITGVTAWDVTRGFLNLLNNITVYGYAGHYDDPDAPASDIHFGVPAELYFTLLGGAINVTQFNVYWSPYMAEITDKDSKLLSCWLKLTSADIFNLDFSKLVYIDGSYWRINKIEDWDAGEPDVCKAELLKVINLSY